MDWVIIGISFSILALAVAGLEKLSIVIGIFLVIIGYCYHASK